MDKFDNLADMDLYEMLELQSTCTSQDVKKAYRKKALTCHPDKNPDNPKAAELFLELSSAVEILLDEKARAAYDKVYNARKAAKIRTQELDSRRKRLKEELDARERQSEQGSNSKAGRTAAEKFAAEVDRLRKEGSRLLKEEMESIAKQIAEERDFLRTSRDLFSYRLKLSWKSDKDDENNGGYNTKNLYTMFSKYGDVEVIVVSQKKKGSALVEFEKTNAAEMAMRFERGLIENPLRVRWVSGPPPACRDDADNFNMFDDLPPRLSNHCSTSASLFPSADPSSASANSNNHSSFKRIFGEDDDEGFEMNVLRIMREAEENKRRLAARKNTQ